MRVDNKKIQSYAGFIADLKLLYKLVSSHYLFIIGNASKRNKIESLP